MRSQVPGMAVFTSTAVPESVPLIKKNIWNSIQNRKNLTVRKNENISETPEHAIHTGDIVQHFKREWVSPDTSEYLYKVLAVAHHTENGEKLMIYQALYAPFKICARPYDMFMSEVDREKYPDIKQKYRFEKYTEE